MPPHYTGILIGQDGQSMAVEAATIFKSLGNLCPKDLAYSMHLSGEYESSEQPGNVPKNRRPILYQ